MTVHKAFVPHPRGGPSLCQAEDSAAAVPPRPRINVRNLRVPVVAAALTVGLAIVLGMIFQPAVMLLKAPLERRFAPTVLSPGDRITGLVVPGGSLARSDEAIRLAAKYPEARIFLSGPLPAEVAILRNAPILEGRFVIEDSARSTFENASSLKRIASPKPGERWILVTSATHMPRAMATFWKAGFPVEPWPIDDANASPKYAANVIAWEVAALVYYRLCGRTQALFPGPDDIGYAMGEASARVR